MYKTSLKESVNDRSEATKQLVEIQREMTEKKDQELWTAIEIQSEIRLANSETFEAQLEDVATKER